MVLACVGVCVCACVCVCVTLACKHDISISESCLNFKLEVKGHLRSPEVKD